MKDHPDAMARLEAHRAELTGYAYRKLGSSFEAEDAVQETLLRAWRGLHLFEGRAALRSWLYTIAANVCMDMLTSRQRRAHPVGVNPANADEALVEPPPGAGVRRDAGDPAETAIARESVRLALGATLRSLPPRQRAVLILREVLRWRAAEVAELLGTTVASVNSALQRARATLATSTDTPRRLRRDDVDLLGRYVDAFERHDMESLTALLLQDARPSMPRSHTRAA